MTNKFSQRSQNRLNTCDPQLIELFEAVLQKQDCTILEGHRSEERQNKLFAKGNSQVRFPNSRHNSFPSQAVDCVPYPIDWDNIDRFKKFMELVKETAEELDIEIECGGEWRTFKDYPHYQLKRD